MSETTRPGSNRTNEVNEAAWTGAFEEKSSDAFGDTLAEDVTLEAAALMRPIRGRAEVTASMTAASNYYRDLRFTHEATAGSRTYIEWEAVGASGVEFSGVTVLARNAGGLIEHVSISHRPLGAILEFSAEMARRTAGQVAPGHFRAEEHARDE